MASMNAPTTKLQSPAPRVIGDLETLKAMSDPLRMRILEVLDRPRTVTEVSEQLGVPRTRLYYHFKILESHDLVEVADTRIVSGILERSYRATAARYALSPELSPALLATSGALASVFDEARAEFEASLAATRRAPVGERGLISRTAALLASDRYKEFLGRLSGLIDEFEGEGTSGPRPAPARTYKLFVALYPDDPTNGEDTPCESP